MKSKNQKNTQVLKIKTNVIFRLSFNGKTSKYRTQLYQCIIEIFTINCSIDAFINIYI